MGRSLSVCTNRDSEERVEILGWKPQLTSTWRQCKKKKKKLRIVLLTLFLGQADDFPKKAIDTAAYGTCITLCL